MKKRGSTKELEKLINFGRYKGISDKIKDNLQSVIGKYEKYAKPANEVKRILAKEIPESVSLSREIVYDRKKAAIN